MTGLLVRPLAVDRHVDLLAERLELRRWRRGGRRRRRPAAGCGPACAGDCASLADVGRLAGALQADQHDHRRAAASAVSSGTRSSPSILISSSWTIEITVWAGVSDLQHLLADRALAHRGDEVAHDLEVDVGFEQRAAHLAHRLVDVGLGQPARGSSCAKDGRLGFKHVRLLAGFLTPTPLRLERAAVLSNPSLRRRGVGVRIRLLVLFKEERVDKRLVLELREVGHLLAGADVGDRNAKFARDGEGDAALGRCRRVWRWRCR